MHSPMFTWLSHENQTDQRYDVIFIGNSNTVLLVMVHVVMKEKQACGK